LGVTTRRSARSYRFMASVPVFALEPLVA